MKNIKKTMYLCILTLVLVGLLTTAVGMVVFSESADKETQDSILFKTRTKQANGEKTEISTKYLGSNSICFSVPLLEPKSEVRESLAIRTSKTQDPNCGIE